QVVFLDVGIIGCGVLVSVRPKVAEVGHQIVSTVIDAFFEPTDHLFFLDFATFVGYRQAWLVVIAGVKQEHACGQCLGGPTGGVSGFYVGVGGGGKQCNGLLEVVSDLRVGGGGWRFWQVFRFGF